MRRLTLSVWLAATLAGNAAAGSLARAVEPLRLEPRLGSTASPQRLTAETVRPGASLALEATRAAPTLTPYAIHSHEAPRVAAIAPARSPTAAPAFSNSAAPALAPAEVAGVLPPGAARTFVHYGLAVPKTLDAASLDAFFEQAIARGDAVRGAALETAHSRMQAERTTPIDFRLGRRLAHVVESPDGTKIGLMTEHRRLPTLSGTDIYGRPLPGALRDIVADLPRKVSSALRLAFSKIGLAAPPKRLLAGESAWPYKRPGDVTMDTNPAVRPKILGSISSPPFSDGAFREIYWERMSYKEFTGANAGALKEAARILRPGGRLDIRTGYEAPYREIIHSLEAAGFVKIIVRRNGDITAWTAAKQLSRHRDDSRSRRPHHTYPEVPVAAAMINPS